MTLRAACPPVCAHTDLYCEPFFKNTRRTKRGTRNRPVGVGMCMGMCMIAMTRSWRWICAKWLYFAPTICLPVRASPSFLPPALPPSPSLPSLAPPSLAPPLPSPHPLPSLSPTARVPANPHPWLVHARVQEANEGESSRPMCC